MASSSRAPHLYRPQELAFLTQYAELKDRVLAASSLLPGTPGSLVKRDGTGYAYWYRAYYLTPGTRVETLVCKDGETEALQDWTQKIEFARWVAEQVRSLRKLGFQVAEKGVAGVLVELHSAGMLEAGLTLVGTIGYMAWLNELGVIAVSSQTRDVDLSTQPRLKLAAGHSFLETVKATQLGFHPVPGIHPAEPATSLKLKGRDGLRIVVLTDGPELGRTVPIPQLKWHAQTVPFFEYLTEDAQPGSVLAGGHCIPVCLPQPERFIWHKLYSSTSRQASNEKAQKDLLQAATLAAVLVEQQDVELGVSFAQAPLAVQQVAASRLHALRRLLAGHPQTVEQFDKVLSGGRQQARERG